ncbi:hypothetical protein TELCIR_08384 [Teladorsagia circumcincta]|uniref:Uncharacterized protein n=1 Tax=Teladorsagia circumcincta TaxID=45464 RepID=A0A2G9UJ78_TELCI|nr:hypothetical protein TELCIR_08384 [Teladorsagia circumcincta]
MCLFVLATLHCSGISNYCIQKIDKRKNQIIRECSSFTDEHNMEEKCPMSGCHWQSAHETYCCCQFDHCNEWKSDGTAYKKSETVPLSSMSKSGASSLPSGAEKPWREPVTESPWTVNYPKIATSPRIPAARNDEIRLD